MLRIDTSAPESLHWLELFPADKGDTPVRLQVARVTRAMQREAWNIAAAQQPGITESSSPDELQVFGEACAIALIILGARDWEGVGDMDGAALPFTPENLEAALADPVAGFFEAAHREYVAPVNARRAEKNGYALSLDGTGTGATDRGTIAALPARPKKTGAAKNARTAPNGRNRQKAK